MPTLPAIIQNLHADIALLQTYINRRQGSDFHDMETMVEALSIPIFNTIMGWNLQSANLIKVNHPAIDLVDSNNGVAVQVTTNASPAKIKKTVNTFKAHKLEAKYPSLYILGFCEASGPVNRTDCTVLGMDNILSALKYLNDTRKVQTVWDAIRTHHSYHHLHPLDDLNCLKIVLNFVNRNAIKHDGRSEGHYGDMVSGLNEISELVGKGTVNGQLTSKSQNHFNDPDIKKYLHDLMNNLSEIVAITNRSRQMDGAWVYINEPDSKKIDAIRTDIIRYSNDIAQAKGISNI